MSDYDAESNISLYEKQLQECLSKRQNAYLEDLGGWQQQLDAIYHDIDTWKSSVTAIKKRFPKPEYEE
jgi:hypothetical protein